MFLHKSVKGLKAKRDNEWELEEEALFPPSKTPFSFSALAPIRLN